MSRDHAPYSAAAASIPLRIDPAFLSHRAQASAAAERLTTAAIGLSKAREARPEDTEGAARALLEPALAAKAAADAVVLALLSRLEGRTHA